MDSEQLSEIGRQMNIPASITAHPAVKALVNKIILECAEIVEDYVDNNTFHRAGERIKQHFGVE